MQQAKRHARRIGIAIIGGVVLIAGIIMVPYPGPGWLTVFAGLAILASEFDWAQNVLDRARHYYDGWAAWLARQHVAVRLIFLVLTAIVVVVTIWLLNGFGIISGLFNLDIPWVRSPFIG